MLCLTGSSPPWNETPRIPGHPRAAIIACFGLLPITALLFLPARCAAANSLSTACAAEESRASSAIVVGTAKNAAYRFTSAEEGVWFDIDGDGVDERVAWTQPDSDVAFLALDRDGDGRITSGKELFGNHTLPGVKNGFDALARTAIDTSGIVSGSVTIDDPLFARLILWIDANHNGMSEPLEMQPVTKRVAEIGLGYEVHNRKDGNGNRFVLRGWVSIRTAPGRNKARNPKESAERRRVIYDVVLATVAPDSPGRRRPRDEDPPHHYVRWDTNHRQPSNARSGQSIGLGSRRRPRRRA